MWSWFAKYLVGENGYLILDDTTWRRWTKKAEAVSYVWDSSAGKVVFGMNVVLLIWTDGKRKVPLGIRVWKKGGKSKVKLAKELLVKAKQNEITPMYVLFDSWYSATELLNLIAGFRWRYIGGVKRNRMLDKVRIDKLFHHRFGRKAGNLRKVEHARIDCQTRQKILSDERSFSDEPTDQNRICSSSADRRNISTAQTRVRLGQVSGEKQTSTNSTSASRIIRPLFGSNESQRANCVSVQTELISGGDPDTR
jgi:hypothetical protein